MTEYWVRPVARPVGLLFGGTFSDSGMVGRVRVTLTVTVRVSRVSGMVSVRDIVK